MIHGVCYSRRRIFAVFLVFLVPFLAFTVVFTLYDLREHKWIYVYLSDLPQRYEATYRADNKIDPVWQPGKEHVLVDAQEPYLKSHHVGAVHPTKSFFQILHYNEEANHHAHLNTRVIQDTCAYQNCHFTSNRTLFQNSSAVIFALSHGKTTMAHVLPRKIPGQVWIFFDGEPPVINSNFYYRHHSWRNVMNWSMSYRLDSDIAVPYGTLKSRTPEELPDKDYSAIYKKKTKFAFWLVSNCDKMVFSARNEYVNELRKYIPVDTYGACGTNIGNDVSSLFTQYKFYLSFENSFCRGYVTEKFFFRFSEDAVLVVRGGVDYDQMFPGDAFVNAGNFMNAASLAKQLLQIGQSEQLYTNYLRSKDSYYSSGSLNWQCQMCAKLNNQEKYQKVYASVVTFWNKNVCWKAGDVPAEWSRCYVVTSLVIVLLIVSQCFWFAYRSRSFRPIRIVDAAQFLYNMKQRL